MFNPRISLFSPAEIDDSSGGGAPGLPPDKSAPDLASLQARIKELEVVAKRLPELEEESRTWYGRYQELSHRRAVGDNGAEGGGETEEEGVPDEEIFKEVDLPEGVLLDDLSKGQIDGLVKKGVITRKDLPALLKRERERTMSETRKMIREEVRGAETRATFNQRLIKSHPEIDDPKSELFKEVQAYIKLKNNPALFKNPDIFEQVVDLQAERLKLRASGNNNRSAAIAAQQGATGGGGSFDEDDDDQMSPAQRRMLDAFNADGELVVTDDSFRKRARAGVKMDGPTAFAMHNLEKRGGRRG